MFIATLSDGTKMIVLEPDTIDLLKSGQPAPVRGVPVVLCYTPDGPFLAKEMERAGGRFSPRQFGEILDAANKRPEVRGAGEIDINITGDNN